LHEKGIFRVCGADSKIKAYRKAVDNGKGAPCVHNSQDCSSRTICSGKMKWKEGLDIHNIASLLKLYFREMPEPLLTFDLYDAFIAAAGGFSLDTYGYKRLCFFGLSYVK